MSWVFGIVAVLAVLMSAWMRAAGSAVAQIPRADAHHDAAEGRRGARTVADLLDDRPQLVSSVGMVCSGLLLLAAATLVASAPATGNWLVVALVVLVLLTVGDVLPRLVARRFPQPVAYASSTLLKWVVRVGGWAADRPMEENGNGEAATDEEDDDEEELALISSVLRFSETIVREVMVPRLDMVTVDVEAGSDDLAAAAVEHGFSRFPVVEDDEVVGVVLVKDLLPGLIAGEDSPVSVRSVMRPAVFVPEVKQIADLLAEMQASKTHMAIVVDEFGDIAGLVTIEDLLEELVGEISDETDEDEVWVEPLSAGRWKVDARLSVEDLARLLDSDLPEGDWDTVGGLVLGLAERVPEEDETFEVDSASLSVARMQGRRVAEVVVTAGPSRQADR